MAEKKLTTIQLEETMKNWLKVVAELNGRTITGELRWHIKNKYVQLEKANFVADPSMDVLWGNALEPKAELTTIQIDIETRDKLQTLADAFHRSMVSQVKRIVIEAYVPFQMALGKEMMEKLFHELPRAE